MDALDKGSNIRYVWNYIADMYRYGEGVEQDYDKAIEYYTKAANLGDTSAKETLKELQGQ
ncbi:MAG: SEL1-like repeat protein [Clostridiales bacterium]|nr:SEL1-like repeat protein [Clostridiales bacterium]